YQAAVSIGQCLTLIGYFSVTLPLDGDTLTLPSRNFLAIAEILGHSYVKTTMNCIHVPRRDPKGE
ncbi:MAG: hypothetical protein ACRD2L_16800, partial [Terriglobia bacterium]